MPSSPIDVLARHLEHVTVAAPLTDLLDLPALAEVLDTLPDPRSRRGRRYRLGPLLALALLAVLGGATSLAKITRIIAGYDPELRARAGLPGPPRLAASTLGRLLARLDGDAFDTATCGYLASLAACAPPATTSSRSSSRTELAGLAVDGKTLRGSRTTDTTVHLLAATRHDTQTALAQRQVEASNEIPAFTPLLSGLDLSSVMITADALHTQHEHARQIVEAGGHYLFIVKGNQPTLLNHPLAREIPWQMPAGSGPAAREVGNGAARRAAGRRLLAGGPAAGQGQARSRDQRSRTVGRPGRAGVGRVPRELAGEHHVSRSAGSASITNRGWCGRSVGVLQDLAHPPRTGHFSRCSASRCRGTRHWIGDRPRPCSVTGQRQANVRAAPSAPLISRDRVTLAYACTLELLGGRDRPC
ncbi:hypothetical protein FHR32_004420 [Streptosporangium album]|uniref:ISAs1 family transposase n=1 Tax=Streptosporangium album TaxID=47479 RepID=A0A7W7RXT2_9ACTN|nr:ISAs1 family transposase [Streptosporangium album]MBB4940115.1 hypothetical protein [Streptosporangium album]